jgi:hypothetical protein
VAELQELRPVLGLLDVAVELVLTSLYVAGAGGFLSLTVDEPFS